MTSPPSIKVKNKNLFARRGFINFTRIFFSLICAAIICQFQLDYIEFFLYDLRTRFSPTSTSGRIELVIINQETLRNRSGFPSASDQTELLKILSKDSPSAIFYDFDLNKSAGSYDDKSTWARTISELPHIYLSTDDLPLLGEKIKPLPPPLQNLKIIPAPKAKDTMNFAKDGVTRRLMLIYQDSKMLQLQVAELANPEISELNKIRGRFSFLDTDQIFIKFNPSNFYPRTEFSQLLKNPDKSSRFKDKIVLIGTDLALGEEEYAATPYSRNPSAMTRLEVQANAVDTLIQNLAPIRAPNWVNWLLTSIVSVLTVYVVLSMKPLRGLAVLGAAFVAVCLLAYGAFATCGFWIGMAHPLLAIFLCYYFFIPYRLIVENRRSWEYYQKNKLLRQVEELKGNFISMMSHDLKTPLARIQGMTDMILTDSNTLSSSQREGVDTIRQSSNDLLKFINAILNYGRIESEGVQLHLQSKDVNSILSEVILKNEFLAKVKRIKIQSELEPLFPIRMDADLMRQVFSNLVENAIKYSGEDTQIKVSSREQDDKVVVEIADQGFGIPADELPNIFMKFFRSNNAKSSPIKGSGLGLYLAKYFIELHGGRVFVDSTYGVGSTFRVELPITQGR